jgi:hypothetical protein
VGTPWILWKFSLVNTTFMGITTPILVVSFFIIGENIGRLLSEISRKIGARSKPDLPEQDLR